MAVAAAKYIYQIQAEYQGKGEIRQLQNDLNAVGQIQAFEKLEGQILKTETRLEKAEQKAAKLKVILEDTGTKKAAADFSKAETEVKKLSESLEKQNAKLEGMAVGLKEAGVETRSLTASQKQLESSLQNQGNLIASRNQLGVRSFAEIRAEIAGLEKAYANLKASGASLNELNVAQDKLKLRTAALHEEMKSGPGIYSKAKAGILDLRSAALSLSSAFAGISIAVFAKEIWDAGLASQALDKSFKAIYGSSEKAANELAFLKAVSNELGLDFQKTAEQYRGLAAASKGTIMEGQNARKIFIGISEAMSVLGGSADQTSGALNAVSQMMSKGKIQAEELRGQLGERLYGAFQMVAQSMGITTARLDKMLDSGQVGIDVLMKFSDVLHKEYGEAAKSASDQAQQAANRLTNAWFNLRVELANSGFLSKATGFINDLAEALKDPAVAAAAKELIDTFFSFTNSVIRAGAGIKGLFEVVSGSMLEVYGLALKFVEAYSKITDILHITNGAYDEVKASSEAALNAASDLAGKAGKDFGLMVNGLKNTSSAAKETGSVVQETFSKITDQQRKQQQEADLTAAKNKLLPKSYSEIKLEIEKLKNAYDELKFSGASVEDLRIAENKLKDETKKLTDEMNGVTDSTKKAGEATDATAQAMQQGLAGGMKDAVDGFMQMGDASQESADRQKDSVAMVTDEVKARYKAMADEVMNLLKSIADRQLSLTADLADMARGGMSSADAWKDMKKQADDYYKSAKEAAEAGNMDESIMYADKAKEAYKQLNHEVKDGKNVVVSAEEARKTAMEGTKKAGELAIENLKKRKDTVSSAGQEMDSHTGGELSRTMPDSAAALSGESKTVDENMKAVDTSFSDIWNKGADSAEDSFSKISQGLGGMSKQMDQMKGQFGDIWSRGEADAEAAAQKRKDAEARGETPTSTTKQYNWGLREGGLLGEVIQRLAVGGGVRPMNALSGLALRGYGGGDRRLILGEDGEVMIRKESVRAAGKRAALAFNAGRFDIVMDELQRKLGVIRRSTGGFINPIPVLSAIRIPELPRIQFPLQAMAAGGTVRKVEKVYELRSGDHSLQGSQSSVEGFLRQIKAEGMLTG